MHRVSLFIALILAAHAPRLAAQGIEVTLLGTGDPTPSLERFGPSSLLEAGDNRLLFDAGRGVMQRLYQLGVSTGSLNAIFLTHLHSDHVVGLVDLWLTGWVVDGRTEPLRVHGPPGTREMISHLKEAFSFDISIRANEARRSPAGVTIEVVEIHDGFRWEEGGTVVDAFLVDHQPVEPAFGFRVTHAGRSVVFSGDTRYSEALIRRSEGADVIIHEVAEAPAAVKAARPNLPRLAHHTQAADAGRVFSAVRPQLAVYSHLVLVGGLDAGELIPLTRATYDGPLVVGEDLMTISIGERVTVGSRAR